MADRKKKVVTKRGRKPKPEKDKKIGFSIYLKPEVKDTFVEATEAKGTTPNEAVTGLIEDYNNEYLAEKKGRKK